MTTIVSRRCSGPHHRRVFLQTGATILGGLSLADIFRLRARGEEGKPAVNDTAVLFVWLPGGTSPCGYVRYEARSL